MARNGNRRGDDALILELARGTSIREAARIACMGERTAHRRLADPSFRRKVSGVRDRQFERAATLLGEASTSAVQALVALLDAPSVQAQLGAARAILEHGGRMRESVELAARIAKLEEQSDPSYHQASRAA